MYWERFPVNTTLIGETWTGGVFMYAIIETGGKQYKVNEGDILFVERLADKEGSR